MNKLFRFSNSKISDLVVKKGMTEKLSDNKITIESKMNHVLCVFK